jgi:hypothetical protein
MNELATYNKMAIVHDDIHVDGVSERILEGIVACFPNADLSRY